MSEFDQNIAGNGPEEVAAERRPFTEAEQTRFRNLLTLAAQSPFDGERAAALSAATRMANRHGMTLQDAASGGANPAPPPPPPPRPRQRSGMAREAGRAIHMMDAWLARDKERRDAALAEARARGLDAEEDRDGPARPPRRFGGKRDPVSHARVLLAETSLPMTEICALTGLDIYQVVGLKLKMRPAVGV